MSTYEQLTKTVSDLQNKVETIQYELDHIYDDGNYKYYKPRLDAVPADGSAWIDSEWKQWSGSDAHTGWLEAINYVGELENRKKNLTTQLETAKASLKDALQAVTDYEKNSPTLKNELDIKSKAIEAGIKINQAVQANKKIIVITIAFFIVVVGISITLNKINKNKSKN